MRVRMRELPDTLCARCEHGQVMGSDYGHVLARCDVTVDTLTVPFPATSCNRYEQRGRMTKHEAERIAWVLQVNSGRVVGFRPPKEKE